MAFTRNTLTKSNNYNLPSSNEVAIVFSSEDGSPPIEWDICIYSKYDKPINIPYISKHVDPLTYPLIYPTGGFGWMPKMKIQETKKERKNNFISTLQFYSYKFSVRDEDFNRFLNLGKLSHQFIINSWLKIDNCKLYFINKQQGKLRTELYFGLIDYLLSLIHISEPTRPY